MKTLYLMRLQIDCFSQHYQEDIKYTFSLNSKLKKFSDIKQKFDDIVKKEKEIINYVGDYHLLFSQYCSLVIELAYGVETEMIKSYFPILSNALKFLHDWLDGLSSGKKQAILYAEKVNFSAEEESSFDKVTNRILRNYVINNLLTSLKKINENGLRDGELTRLLTNIDLESGIRVSPSENLTDKLTGINQASVSRFNTIQDKVKASPVCPEAKEDIFKTIGTVFSSLEQGDSEKQEKQENSKLLSVLHTVNTLTSDYNTLLPISYEASLSQAITEILKIIQTCVNQREWNSKAKNTFGPPQGVREIRNLLKDKKLSEFEKLVALHKLTSKKLLINSSRRNMLTRVFYENVATNLQAIYDKLDPDNKEFWNETALGCYSGELLRLTWITESQTEQLTEIFKKLKNDTSQVTEKLQQPENAIYATVKEILVEDNSNTAQNEQFERFRRKLQDFKQELFSSRWNKKGIGIPYVYRKLPQGIKDLQKLYSDKKLEFLAGEGKMSPEQLIYLIKVILHTYAILQQRVISPTGLRDAEVQHFYEFRYAYYFRAICVEGRERLDENQSKDLSRELRTLFNFISACEGESTSSILANLGLSTLNDPLASPSNCRTTLFPTSSTEPLSNHDNTNNTTIASSANFSKPPKAQ